MARSSNNLPETVLNLFRKNPPIADVFDLALGPNNSFYVGYLEKSGEAYCKSYGVPAGLTQWLSVNAEGFVSNDIRTTCVALGPNGSYFAQDKNKIAWANLPNDLVQAIEGRNNTDPRIVALGIDGAFVLINKNGSGTWNLKGRYPELEKKFKELSSFGQVQVSYTSLSILHSTLLFSLTPPKSGCKQQLNKSFIVSISFSSRLHQFP